MARMTKSEKAARVLARIPSSSNRSKKYEIRLGRDGVVYCTCPSWRYQGGHPADRCCKHMMAYAAQLEPSTQSKSKKEAA